MTHARTALAAATAGAMLAATASLTIRAQVRPADEPAAATAAARPRGSIQDALLKPFDFPFARPTPLDEVARHLGKTLDAAVVIDQAALDRQSLKADDDVRLALSGVRLKTGLKLLLDQLDLTYRVVPEDNLLVITDETGAADLLSEVLGELKELHRDVHDLQDAVDDLRADLGLDAEAGARMRKPTIIEEKPADAGADPEPKPKDPAPPPVRPRRGT